MPITLVFASNNAHKLQEVRQVLAGFAHVLSLAEAGIEANPEETADTFEGNALIKAREIFALTQLPTLADDSGLEVEALLGRPGVQSARFAGPNATDAENTTKLLASMQAVANRSARFRTVLAYIDEQGEQLFEGIVNGQIVQAPIGDNGFGYDPIFRPDHEARTFAQMQAHEKNNISHRAMALAAFLDASTK